MADRCYLVTRTYKVWLDPDKVPESTFPGVVVSAAIDCWETGGDTIEQGLLIALDSDSDYQICVDEHDLPIEIEHDPIPFTVRQEDEQIFDRETGEQIG